jgi:hypothetical protein
MFFIASVLFPRFVVSKLCCFHALLFPRFVVSTLCCFQGAAILLFSRLGRVLVCFVIVCYTNDLKTSSFIFILKREEKKSGGFSIHKKIKCFASIY